MKTIILGKNSYISKKLKKKIKNSECFTIKEFLQQNSKLKKFDIIINSFFPVTKLNNINNFQEFTNKSISELSILLDKLKFKNIRKIIYTSSSSVYNLNIDKPYDSQNRNLYGSYKIACENLLHEAAKKNNFKNYTIARIYNIYGGKEEFSIISKIEKTINKNKQKIIIYNNGESVRDFIFIDDVCKIYKQILKTNFIGDLDIGTGEGVKILNLLENLKINKKKIVFKSSSQKNSYSIANTNNLSKLIKINKLKKIDKYLNIKKNKIEKYKRETTNKILGSAIYGCGFSGLKIAKELLKVDRKSISFFIDDDPYKIGKTYFGIKVISFSYLKFISSNYKLKNIIFAIPSLDEKTKIKILAKLYGLSLSVSFLPEKKFFENRNVEKIFLQEFNLENLLNRDIYKISSQILEKFKNKRILITGGAGSIGSQICIELLKSKPKEIILYDNSEYNIFKIDEKLKKNNIKFILGDINDPEFLKKIINKKKIDYLFHAAAYKHVKYCENNVCAAVKNNIFGTLNVLNSIKNTDIKFVFVSTDKAVNPKNVLGMTKRIAEILIVGKNDEYTYKKNKIQIVRFGNVLGSAGSAIPKFIDQIRNGKPITITDLKMKRYFMNISEAANLVIESTGIRNKNNQIFILKMGKQIKIINIAKKLFEFYKNKDQNFKFKITGNISNEKIGENLSISKKKIATNNKKIFLVNEPTCQKKYFNQFITKLNKTCLTNNNEISLKLLKSFFKKYN